jgi:hypothetical protein
MSPHGAPVRHKPLRFSSIYPHLIENTGWAEACDFTRFASRSKLAPIFVIGAPRSGTTLVAKCLGAHPAIACADESTFLLNLWHLYSCWFKGLNTRGWKPLDEYMDEKTLLESTQVFAETIFRSLAKKQGKKFPLDHTPWYSVLVPFLRALFPRARFVHVIRDGRAVVASLAHSYRGGRQWCGATTKQRAQLWTIMVEASLRGRALARRGQYFEMRYEKLCQDPVKELSAVLAGLDLKFSADVLKPLAVGHAGPSRKNAAIAKYVNGKLVIQTSDRPSRPRTKGGKSEADFTAIAGRAMRKLGYR